MSFFKKADESGPSAWGWSFLHFQVASFLRFMAANLRQHRTKKKYDIIKLWISR